MPRLQSIFKFVNAIPDSSVDQAMAAALATADPQATRLIADSILQRGHPKGTIGLILHYHRLPSDIQTSVIQRVTDFYRPLRQVAGHTAVQGRANVIEIVRRSRHARLAYLLAEELRRGPTSLYTPAAEALLELAKWAASDPDPACEAYYDPVSAQFVQSAIADSLAAFAHHGRREVLFAAMQLAPRPMADVVRHFTDVRAPATEAMRILLESATDMTTRRSLLAFIAVPTLSRSAMTGVRVAVRDGNLDEVLATGHMLKLPDVAAAISQIGDSVALTPRQDAIHAFPPHAGRYLPTWINALPSERPAKVHTMDSLRRSPHSTVRLAALRMLMRYAEQPDSHQATSAIVPFCHDSDVRIARIALRYLTRRQYAGLHALLLKLVNSTHEQVRRLAGRQVAPIGFAKLWQSWPKLSYSQQVAAGRALIKIDPRFHVQLGEKLVAADLDSRLQAMAIIRLLNQAEFFEPALIELAGNGDDMIASAAVRALGTSQSPLAASTLQRALEHSNSRVRANAVEALHQQQYDSHVDRLVEMSETDDNRPRANAIGALMEMRFGDAIASLANMLNDERPMHRVSALWLVDHLGLHDMARHVAELAVEDSDANVRHRANQVVHRMIESMRSQSRSEGVDGDIHDAPAGSAACNDAATVKGE